MATNRRDFLIRVGPSAVALAPSLLNLRESPARESKAREASTKPFQHSIYQSFPGKPAIDAWGWTGTINYQRTLGHANPDELVALARKSNRWGANLIEVMPFKIACGGYVMSWDPDDPIAQPDHGAYFYEDPEWTDQAYRALFARWHSMDMLAALCVNSIGATWSELGPGWKRPTGSVEADVMERWARDFFNRFAYAEEGGYLDILDTERISGMELPLMWSFNPGASPVICAGADHRQEGFIYAFCCAARKRDKVNGLDDRSGYDFDPKYPYFSYQADARTRKTLHSWGRFGGFTYPDWIVKQVFDFCRVRKLQGHNLHTAIWWFNDVAEMHSPIDKQYVHGATLDPLRSAIAARLFVTGQFPAYCKKVNPEGVGGLPERDQPRGTPMLHNNHLALYLPPWRQGGELLLDRQHLGEFHNLHDEQLTLTRQLLRVRLEGAAAEPEALKTIRSLYAEREQPLSTLLADRTRISVAQAGDFCEPGGFPGPHDVHVYRHPDDRSIGLPGGLRHAGNAWPANLDLKIEVEAGSYVLLLKTAGIASLEISLNGERIAVEQMATDSAETLPVVFAVTLPGEQTLSLMCWDGELQFDRVDVIHLGDFAVGQRVGEPAGFMARWEEQVVLPVGDASLIEQRRYTMIDDAPWLEVEIERTWEGNSPRASLMTDLGCEAYDTLRTGDAEYRKEVDFDELTEELELVDSTGEAPPLIVAFRERGQTSGFSFRPKDKLTLASPAGNREKLSLVIMAPQGLYSDQEIQGRTLPAVRSQRASLDEEHRLTVANELDLPVVRLIELSGRDQGPFYVCEPLQGQEQAWWMVRGGHNGYREDATFVRLYLQPQRQARIARYDFIDGCVKGGIGAQHTLALREDVSRNACTARVLNVTPYVFAPPVEFAESFSQVKLDGQQWHYFQGNTVYLPAAKGQYEIRTSADAPRLPHVVATQARVAETHWDDDTLTISVETPPWYEPGLAWYFLGVHCEGRTVSSVVGDVERIDFGSLRIRDAERKAMENHIALKVKPGTIAVHFRPLDKSESAT